MLKVRTPQCYKTIQIKDTPCNKKILQLFIISYGSISKFPLVKVFAPERLILEIYSF